MYRYFNLGCICVPHISVFDISGYLIDTYSWSI